MPIKFISIVVTCIFLSWVVPKHIGAAAERANVLHGALPSPAGKTVSAIMSMPPDTWLDLGRPRPDPAFGLARGRAWSSKMAFSRALGGAFLFGEGEHGWSDPANGRYMDGLWFYDVNGHRWVNLYAGTNTRSPPELVITGDGFEGISPIRPLPVATMVHGYEMIAWDPGRQIFFSMPNYHGYYKKALPTVADFRRRNATRLNRNAASPWMFDPWNRLWHRLKTPTGSPKSGYGDVLMFIPSKQMLFFYHNRKVSFYDPAKNRWQFVTTNGPAPPFGIDPTACQDPGRNRVYIGGGNYPISKGPNALWIFEVQTESWMDPQPAGSPGGNHYGTNVAVMTCDTRNDRVYLFRHAGKMKGVFVYDAKKNAWNTGAIPLPKFWRDRSVVNGFYHPDLGVHIFHLANDSRANGRIIVYRPAD